MTEPIVYVDYSEIREGQLEAVQGSMVALAEFVEAYEPQILSYAVYIDADGGHMTVVHVHPDSESLAFHLKAAGPMFAPMAPLIRLLSIDVYGRPGPEVVEELRGKAELLGGAPVAVHPPHTGFLRSSPPPG